MTKAPKVPVVPNLLRMAVPGAFLAYWFFTDSPNALYVFSVLAWVWLALILFVFLVVREKQVLDKIKKQGYALRISRPWLLRLEWLYVLVCAFALLWHFHLWVALAVALPRCLISMQADFEKRIERKAFAEGIHRG